MPRRVCLFTAGIVLIGLTVTPAPAAQRGARSAVAILAPTQGNNTKGTVRFHQRKRNTHVIANVTGLTPGKHGFHIHGIGDCSAPDATSAGPHFNPQNRKHGAPDASEHHAGDLGNIEANAQGRGRLNWTVDFLTVADGPNSVVGKSVIVHTQADDLQTQPTGNAGARLACGVIERKK